jgi:hypothetical protein
MSKGYIVFAQNSNVNYVQQAIALAMSLKQFGNNEPISIVTDDSINDNFKYLFDQIIPIPWGDSSKKSHWKIENRWKLYHVSPYDQTIVLDSDILVTDSLKNLWMFVENYDLYFTSAVVNFKTNIIHDTLNRKTFIENGLPNIYSALHYFRKSDLAHSFYSLLELVVKNYNEFSTQYLKKSPQEFVSIDVAAALSIKILDIESQVTCGVYRPVNFYHMKTNLQQLSTSVQSWRQILDYSYNKNLVLANKNIRGVFHYTEKDFLSVELFDKIANYESS